MRVNSPSLPLCLFNSIHFYLQNNRLEYTKFDTYNIFSTRLNKKHSISAVGRSKETKTNLQSKEYFGLQK